jgi:hypothetical protein
MQPLGICHQVRLIHLQEYLQFNLDMVKGAVQAPTMLRHLAKPWPQGITLTLKELTLTTAALVRIHTGPPSHFPLRKCEVSNQLVDPGAPQDEPPPDFYTNEEELMDYEEAPAIPQAQTQQQRRGDRDRDRDRERERDRDHDAPRKHRDRHR